MAELTACAIAGAVVDLIDERLVAGEALAGAGWLVLANWRCLANFTSDFFPKAVVFGGVGQVTWVTCKIQSD